MVSVLRSIACCLFLSAYLSVVASGEASGPPNIIVVMPDDIGYGDFACLGNPIVQTPAIDAFWGQSFRFSNFHVSPTCAPTRAALLTGRHEFKNGVTHTIFERERLTLRATTLADILRDTGYATGIFGKWHLGDEVDRWPDKRGFDEVFIHGGGGIGQSYPGSCGDAPGNRYFNPALLHNGKFEKTEGYCTDLFFGQAIRWIAEVRERGPFFAYITPNAAHGPLDIEERYEKKYRGKVNPNVAKFYGMIENLDENFGKLMRQLTDWGIAENTLVIFLTDNGTATGASVFNAGMRGAKNTPYEGGTRVPSFWRWPGGIQKSSIDCDALTAHMDILPTLAQITGAKLSEAASQQIEGRSLVPLLNDANAEWPDRHLVTHLGRWPNGKAIDSKYQGCSIRNRRYALVNNRELYDLTNDPGQKTNLIAEHPEIANSLRAEYDQWWQEVLPCLENEEVVGPEINPFKVLYEQQFGPSVRVN